VLEWIGQVTALGHRVMAAIARSLGLADDYFAGRYTGNPLILFASINCIASRIEASGTTDTTLGVMMSAAFINTLP